MEVLLHSPRLQHLLFVGGLVLACYTTVVHMILATGTRDAVEDMGLKEAASTYAYISVSLVPELSPVYLLCRMSPL